MSPGEGKGEEKCNADIILVVSGTQVSQGHFSVPWLFYWVQNWIRFLTVWLPWDEKKKNPEMSQIPTRKPYIFTWLIFFLKEPNQSHLFCDIIITSSSVAPHWLALIIILELLDHLLFLFILLWTNRRIVSYLSLILPLTIAITQWLIHWKCSINDS